MKVRPILMSAPMVRALLDGHKTQTRRALKPQPPHLEARLNGPQWYTPAVIGRNGYLDAGAPTFGVHDDDGDWGLKCPYGAPGELLWVRESWSLVPQPAYRISTGVEQRDKPGCDHDAAVFRADWERSAPRPWRSSIHMPRWASRITLELVRVKVQRVQEIGEADSIAEGAPCGFPSEDGEFYLSDHGTHYGGFAAVWDYLNFKRGYGWAENPWVWALTFTVHRCNVDEFIRRRAA